jgi:hypothetical protein
VKLFEDRVNLSGTRAETPQVPEAEDPLSATATRVREDGAERYVIAVDAPEERDRPFEIGLAEQERRRLSDREFRGAFR